MKVKKHVSPGDMAENFQKLMTVSNAHIQETQITISRIITHTHTTYLHTCPFTSELKREKREREMLWVVIK